MADIFFNLDGWMVNLRVAAVVTRGEDVLMCRGKTESWWFLPGGRVKTGESSREALTRELREEIGDAFRIRRPIICSENFFGLHDTPFHEVCTYYEVEWLGGNALVQEEGRSEVFQWIPRAEVMATDLKPEFLKRYILNPPLQLGLVINKEDGEGIDAVAGGSAGD